ncbi:LysM domain-containing protein [Strigomonas culicis]|uniref:LysM domain-containing protein n=1 Tax=Strigomonas culicis TaxID=28005 RepID=S9TG23_9TRYP|nr:LysM domain-containing protein [Strigomonas culicis]|eukprot:EPY15298.1 LysM domain-containing protein [Strigomonas culicis]
MRQRYTLSGMPLGADTTIRPLQQRCSLSAVALQGGDVIRRDAETGTLTLRPSPAPAPGRKRAREETSTSLTATLGDYFNTSTATTNGMGGSSRGNSNTAPLVPPQPYRREGPALADQSLNTAAPMSLSGLAPLPGALVVSEEAMQRIEKKQDRTDLVLSDLSKQAAQTGELMELVRAFKQEIDTVVASTTRRDAELTTIKDALEKGKGAISAEELQRTSHELRSFMEEMRKRPAPPKAEEPQAAPSTPAPTLTSFGSVAAPTTTTPTTAAAPSAAAPAFSFGAKAAPPSFGGAPVAAGAGRASPSRRRRRRPSPSRARLPPPLPRQRRPAPQACRRRRRRVCLA